MGTQELPLWPTGQEIHLPIQETGSIPGPGASEQLSPWAAIAADQRARARAPQ